MTSLAAQAGCLPLTGAIRIFFNFSRSLLRLTQPHHYLQNPSFIYRILYFEDATFDAIRED